MCFISHHLYFYSLLDAVNSPHCSTSILKSAAFIFLIHNNIHAEYCRSTIIVYQNFSSSLTLLLNSRIIKGLDLQIILAYNIFPLFIINICLINGTWNSTFGIKCREAYMYMYRYVCNSQFQALLEGIQHTLIITC